MHNAQLQRTIKRLLTNQNELALTFHNIKFCTKYYWAEETEHARFKRFSPLSWQMERTVTDKRLLCSAIDEFMINVVHSCHSCQSNSIYEVLAAGLGWLNAYGRAVLSLKPHKASHRMGYNFTAPVCMLIPFWVNNSFKSASRERWEEKIELLDARGHPQ